MSDDEATEVGLFGKSDSVHQAIVLINGLAPQRIPKLLQRIMDKLHLPNDKPFTSEEEDALTAAFELESSDISLILNTIAFIFETTAYHNLSPTDFVGHLKNLELEEAQAMIFGKAWAAKGDTVIGRLRDTTFYENEAIDVNWRLNLQLADATQSKTKIPNVQFDIATNTKDGPDHIQMEFTHQQLSKFYTQLEIIQQQLDHLSS